MNTLRQAALALDAGDPIGALQAVALRDDPHSLALRGTAMARIGDLARARTLFRRAEKGFASSDRLARARCVLARAEVQLAMRDGGWPVAALDDARATFHASGDAWNASYLTLVEARRAILLGRLDAADAMLNVPRPAAHPLLSAVANLLRAHLRLRQLRLEEARAALAGAFSDLGPSGFEALRAELVRAETLLRTPVAGRRSRERLLPLDPEALRKVNRSQDLVVDEMRFEVRHGHTVVALVSRPVLFALLKRLATAWPGDSPRATLIEAVFRGRQVDESHRVRLRMEVLRLRRVLGELGDVVATPGGYRLAPKTALAVVVVEPLIGARHARLMALLSDGEAWTSLAIAEAMGASRRSVQRSLEALCRDGLVRKQGAGPAHRWRAMALDPIAASMLLPAVRPSTV